MIEQISAFFTVEMIYMWLNIGVIPFWLMLIIFPQTKVCGLFVTSIIPTFILASVYVYLLYIFFFAGYDFEVSRRVMELDKDEYLKLLNNIESCF